MGVTAVVLAAMAAVGWGASDYFGGDASRSEVPVFVVVAVAELIGVALLTPLSLITVPYGVSLAHQMKKRQMEMALATYLIFISVRFIASMM